MHLFYFFSCIQSLRYPLVISLGLFPAQALLHHTLVSFFCLLGLPFLVCHLLFLFFPSLPTSSLSSKSLGPYIKTSVFCAFLLRCREKLRVKSYSHTAVRKQPQFLDLLHINQSGRKRGIISLDQR